MIAIIIDSIIERANIPIAESGSVPKLPNGTFIPRNEDIIVGTDITIVTPARNFMTSFRLLEIIDAYVSVKLVSISRYILAISIACLFNSMDFSTLTSE